MLRVVGAKFFKDKFVKPSAWTDRWLKQLPWRELQRMKRLCEKKNLTFELTGLEKSRIRRLLAEWERRKREGGGGWAAKRDIEK